MKSTDLRNEVREYILSDVQMTLARLGINAACKFVTEKDYRGNDYLTIETSKFQTMPMMFKELYVRGPVGTYEEEDKEFYEVSIRLEYCWKSFRGGSNGTDLGTIRYQVEKDMPERVGEDSVRYYIHKEHGIEI